MGRLKSGNECGEMHGEIQGRASRSEQKVSNVGTKIKAGK
jgi:hypothetical protein